MSPSKRKPGSKKGRKVRVAFRRNRAKPRRIKDWTEQARQTDDHELDTTRSEHIIAKGDLSRRRTIIETGDAAADINLREGIVVAMRGLFADVDDGQQVWPCTVRRILRTRLIEERHPVTTGDRVQFRAVNQVKGVVQEGVIERVTPRRGQLRRKTGRRIHTMAANVDCAVIVSSAAMPDPKPHLIDRYIVASLAGNITPIICMNKVDLDADGAGRAILERYDKLGYQTLATSAITGDGTDSLREVLKGKASVIVGQSGVGKSSLLNMVQPGLNLRVGNIIDQTQKGRHTTSTAILLKLVFGGYVVDTPGVKSLDLSPVPINEIEVHFREFHPYIPNCKFPDCTHTHETTCAVKQAVEDGLIHPDRYESYVRLFRKPTGRELKSGG